MVAEHLRPYVAELSSRENDQRRRVKLLAENHEHAAAIVEAREREYTEFQLDPDRLEAAREVALYVPRDTDLDGRFHRAGKTVRLRSEHTNRGLLVGSGAVTGSHVTACALGSRETSGLRAAYATHCQEKPYRVDRVGSPDIQMVLASMYGLQWQDQIEGGTNRFVWASDTIKCSLHTSTYTPAVDTDDFFNDATNELSTANGYTAGGATLASKTSTYDTGSDQIRLDAADVSWTSSTLTARYAVIWVDTAGASTADPLLGFVNFESDVSTTNGTFQITWDATGIFVVDVT